MSNSPHKLKRKRFPMLKKRKLVSPYFISQPLMLFSVVHKEHPVHVETPKSNEVAEVKFEKREVAPLSTSN